MTLNVLPQWGVLLPGSCCSLLHGDVEYSFVVEAKAFVEQAKHCLRDGSISVALEFARQAYEIEPDSEEVLCVLGAALSHAGQDEEAEETFFRAVSLFPKSAKAHYNLAVHYYRWGRKEEAWEYVRSALQLAPLHPGVRDLLRLLEEERKLPPVKEAPVDVSVSSPTQPGIVSEVGGKAELLLPRAEHLYPVIEAWGPKWDAGLWVSFVLWMGLSFWLTVELVSQGGSLSAMGLGENPSVLVGGTFMVVIWLVWAVMMVLDLIDRRPRSITTFFGVGSLFSLVGLFCVPLMMAGGLCFIPYYFGSRGKL